MSRRGGGWRAFGALAAAMALFGGQAQAARGMKNGAPIVAEAPQAVVRRQKAIDDSFGQTQRVYRHPDFIWLGRKKYGPRRHRSRWDFRR